MIHLTSKKSACPLQNNYIQGNNNLRHRANMRAQGLSVHMRLVARHQIHFQHAGHGTSLRIENHAVKSQCAYRRQRSPAIIQIKGEATGAHTRGVFSPEVSAKLRAARCALPLPTEALARYSLAELLSTHPPVNLFEPKVQLCRHPLSVL